MPANNRIFPRCLQRPVHLVVIFFLFHLYLLYIIVFAAIKSLHLRAKSGCSGVIPRVPNFAAWKEKVHIFVHNLDLHLPLALHRHSGNVSRMAILRFLGDKFATADKYQTTSNYLMLENLQNLVTSSESCLSTKSKSTISLSFENVSHPLL
ncbi:hypothetical protein OESDEN_04777 [Oesophagostomum dentatum]|uniref:Uncharacterized protein n=1 Tax=Oesophagostomum dentatum TaxID=61180 RepID=A0A0B1TGQ4_OESDE|nr:hypothetical protein OESDEN_04777 [Oesophagostomum dentatum]